jgi:catechol 2,3-dioxygenase-like lactoylglutathione lyase family enzyme
VRLEVVVVPVSDVDRAKEFYASLGWRLDADIEAVRDQLRARGVEVSEVFHEGDRKHTASTTSERASGDPGWLGGAT